MIVNLNANKNETAAYVVMNPATFCITFTKTVVVRQAAGEVPRCQRAGIAMAMFGNKKGCVKLRHPVVISNERKHADETSKLRRDTERVFVCALNHIRKPVGNEAGIGLRHQVTQQLNLSIMIIVIISIIIIINYYYYYYYCY